MGDGARSLVESLATRVTISRKTLNVSPKNFGVWTRVDSTVLNQGTT